MSTWVFIAGVVRQPPDNRKGNLFELENEQGVFVVRVERHLRLACRLVVGDEVQVTGQLCTFVFKRCRSNHVYVEATSVVKVMGLSEVTPEMVARLFPPQARLLAS
jgi:hypothetical protein